MTDNPIYQLSNLTQIYNERVVLQIDYLEIYKGEILAVIGPSGAGKSTLLRQLNFLEKPATGGIRFAGNNINDNTTPPLELRRRITTVFQTPVLLNRSVADNVAYGLQIRGKERKVIKQAVAEALAQVKLSSMANAPTHTLSGGEAQRVALARALVVQPDALLLDEPTANLDPYNAKIIEQIIRELNQQQGTTIVLVTHNIFQAKRLSDRAAFLFNGKIIEIAKSSTFFNSPADSRTAAFVRGDIIY